MPNWCDNSLNVKGPSKDIKRFKKFVSVEEKIIIPKNEIKDAFDKEINNKAFYREHLDLYLEHIKMTPQQYFKQVKRYPFNKNGDVIEQPMCFSFNKINPRPKETKDWYAWNTSSEGWATKWDACDPELNYESKEELSYIFNTAWSPPIPVIEKASKLFPKLNFTLEYSESGNDFAGILECEGGEVIKQEEGSYLDYNAFCASCDSELEKRGEVWYCPSCNVKICTSCMQPAESDEDTICSECGNDF